MQTPLRIVFFGTPAFAAHSLKSILDAGYQVVAVVTAPDKPAGRGMQLRESEVKITARAHGIPVLQPVNLRDPGFQETLLSYQPDLGIVIAFRMLPQAVWSMPRLGTFNLHASLLPQYRGAAPINHAIINGETETGVTTFFLKHEIDTGDIQLQEKVAILPEDNAGSLHDKLMVRGAALVLRTLEKINSGDLTGIPQTFSDQLKPAPKIFPDFCIISETATAEEAHNKIRGLSPVPGAWLPDGSMKVLRSEITDLKVSEGESRHLVPDFEKKQLLWPFQDRFLSLLEVQPKGKKRMSAPEYLNGIVNLKK